MKKLLTFKLFENNDWSEEVPLGFEYSKRDIVDILIDLSDNLDFEIDEITNVYLNEEFDQTKDLQDSTYSGYMVGLKKPKLIDTDPRPYSPGFEFTNGTVEFEIYKELQSISPRFDKFFQNLSFDDDGWYLGLYLLNEVNEEERLQLVEIQKREEAHQKLQRVFSSFYKSICLSKVISPTFRRKMFENKVGESGYGFRGSVKSGFLILPINTSGLSKVVIAKNLTILKDEFLRGLKAYDGEFRMITQSDLQQLLDGVKKSHPKDTYYTLEKLKERYEGLYGFIVNFDYEKCIKELI